MIDYGLTFMTGLLTSMHCIGMCGVIVLAYSAQPAAGAAESTIPPLMLHLAYNLGRILSYALLGAVFGLVGMTISWFQEALDYFAIFSGIIMVISGLALLGAIPVSSRISLIGSNSLMTKIQGKLVRTRSLGSKLVLGFLTPLLPCGILYAMLAKAAASGTAFHGAMTMGIFAIGMTPALTLLGGLSSFFSARLRKGAEQVAAVLVILMGVFLILRGFQVPFLGWLYSDRSCPNCAS